MRPPLSTANVILSTPPDSPLPFNQQALATHPLPVSPPTTASLDPSPHPLHSLPRPISDVLHIIRCRYEGKTLKDSQLGWKRLALNPDEYDQLQNALDKDKALKGWVEDKLRLDYDSVLGEIVIRMPSHVHDIFARGLDGKIESRIKRLRAAGNDKRQHKINEVVKGIQVDSTSDIKFPRAEKQDRKSPDSSFAFLGSKYPPVVIEVANSQQGKKLPELADFYMENSRGRIRTVIAVDIEYRRPGHQSAASGREAVFSIYRHRLVRDTATGQVTHREAHPDPENQCFRRQDLTVPDGAFELSLSDFCPPGTLADSNGPPIRIPHQTLANLLSYAEKRQATMERASPSSDDNDDESVPFKSKHKLSPTPGLIAEDEAAFQVAEAEELAREAEKDSSLEASSSFSTVEDDLPQRSKRIKTRSDPGS